MTNITVAFHNFPHAPKNSTGIWAWQDRATIRKDAAKIRVSDPRLDINEYTY